MELGFVLSKHGDYTIPNYQQVWIDAVYGVQVYPQAEKQWADLNPNVRGIVMYPAMQTANGIFDHASKTLEWLQHRGYSNWNNGVPILVDFYKAAGNERFNLDNLRTLGQAITATFGAVIKPRLRVNPSTYQAWLAANEQETMRLWNDFDPLWTQFGVTKPVKIPGLNVLPDLWEYAEGDIAYDESRLWTVSPVKPAEPPEEPEEPEPPEEPEEPEQPPTMVPVKKYALYLFGIRVGRIEAINE